MNSVTLNVLSEMTTISASTLRVYLSHYSLYKYQVPARNSKARRCIGCRLSKAFIRDFVKYLTVTRGKQFAQRTLQLMKEYEKYKGKYKC